MDQTGSATTAPLLPSSLLASVKSTTLNSRPLEVSVQTFEVFVEAGLCNISRSLSGRFAFKLVRLGLQMFQMAVLSI